MDQMKQVRNLRVAAIGYSIFTALNLFLHILNYYYGFMGIGADRLLYAAKVLVCALVWLMTSRYGDERFAPIATAMKITVLCDLLEILITEMAVEIKGFALVLFIALLLSKILADYLFYLEFAEKKSLRTIWIGVNAILVFLVLGALGYSWFITVSYLFAVIRYAMALFIIFTFKPLEHCDKKSIFRILSEKKLSARSKRITITVTAVLVIIFLCLRYLIILQTDDYIMAGEDTRQYAVSNFLPNWTGFQEKRYGIVNTKTGEKTKPIFHHVLNHDDSGIAWEENGKFVDLNGNIVFEVPRATMAAIGKRALRTTLLNNSLDALFGDNKPQYIDWKGELLYHDDRTMVRVNGMYFSNGVCAFYSEKYGAYGYIDNHGRVIANPEMVKFSGKYNKEVSLVVLKNTGKTNVINSDGNYLFDKNLDWADTEIDYEVKIVIGKTHFGRNVVKSDFFGNYIE